MPKSVTSCRKQVRYGSVDVRIVPFPTTYTRHPFAQKRRQELPEGDHLHHCTNISACSLKYLFIACGRIFTEDMRVSQCGCGNSAVTVVFANKERVHTCKYDVFIRAYVASQKESLASGLQIVKMPNVLRQQLVFPLLQLAALEGTQRVRPLLARSVDVGAINVGRQLVDLLPGAAPTGFRSFDLDTHARHHRIIRRSLATDLLSHVLSEVEFVVEELAPRPHEISQSVRTRSGAVLATDTIAYVARIRPGTTRRAVALLVRTPFTSSAKRFTRLPPLRVFAVVVGTVVGSLQFLFVHCLLPLALRIGG